MIKPVQRCHAGCLIVVLCVAFVGAQTPQSSTSSSDYQLRVAGEVEHELNSVWLI